MAHIAYYRVSTHDQSIDTQRAALTRGCPIDHEYTDEGVSGAMPAAQRKAFADLLKFIRAGDTLHVYAVDRLGRDAIDVQATIRYLLDEKKATVSVHGLGVISRGAGELIIAVLAQVADMERQRIRERTSAGRELAKAAFVTTGKTHRGKEHLGRPPKAEAGAVKAWRVQNQASIKKTAEHFGLSESTVKRYTAAA